MILKVLRLYKACGNVSWSVVSEIISIPMYSVTLFVSISNLFLWDTGQYRYNIDIDNRNIDNRNIDNRNIDNRNTDIDIGHNNLIKMVFKYIELKIFEIFHISVIHFVFHFHVRYLSLHLHFTCSLNS